MTATLKLMLEAGRTDLTFTIHRNQAARLPIQDVEDLPYLVMICDKRNPLSSLWGYFKDEADAKDAQETLLLQFDCFTHRAAGHAMACESTQFGTVS